MPGWLITTEIITLVSHWVKTALFLDLWVLGLFQVIQSNLCSHVLLMNFSLSLTIILVESILVNRETRVHSEIQKKGSRTVSQLCIPGVPESNIHDQTREVSDPNVIPWEMLLILLLLSLTESRWTPTEKNCK